MTEIRLIDPGDRAMIQPLLAEIHHHYHGEQMPETSMERTLHDLFEERSCAMLVAVDQGRAIGLATYAIFQPSTDGGGTMFVKDIFVSEHARRQRLGRQLLVALVDKAESRGCNRIDWTTDSINEDAQLLYDRLGAERVSSKVFFRVMSRDYGRFRSTCAH
ncbi:MAG: GNAT family N-acetyltransferase [Pseudomonadota bacterium]